VIKILARSDSSIAQIPQNHFEIVDLIRQTGSEEQKRLLFKRILEGARLGNAFSEYKGKNVEDFQTRIKRHGDDYVVTGEKFYSTGALFAHLVPIIAISEDDGKVYAAIAERTAPGLTVIDDWTEPGRSPEQHDAVRCGNEIIATDVWRRHCRQVLNALRHG
jgi:alkylation response protein AidB-like acyl-CoA dehydrogenase